MYSNECEGLQIELLYPTEYTRFRLHILELRHKLVGVPHDLLARIVICTAPRQHVVEIGVVIFELDVVNTRLQHALHQPGFQLRLGHQYDRIAGEFPVQPAVFVFPGDADDILVL